MATAATPGSSDKVLTDINEQMLQCAICMKRLTSPKLLPCQHTYCEVCLTEWVNENNGQLICPTCKELHPLPSGGVKAITNNRIINDLLQLISDTSPETEQSVCEGCDSEARHWCTDCGQFFCDECIRTHRVVRSLKDHKVISVEEYNEKSSSEHSRLIQPRFCDSHPSTQLEFYCDTCQVPTCVKCFAGEHVPPEHEMISIESALEKYMPTLKKYTKTVEQRVNDLKQTKDRVSSDGADLEKMKTSAESQIKDFAKSVFDKLKQQEIKLQDEVSDIYAPKRKQIDSQIELLEHKLVSAERLHSYLNHLLTFGGPVDIMTAKKEMEQRLRQHDSQEIHCTNNHDDSDLVFTENPECALMDLGHLGANMPVLAVDATVHGRKSSGQPEPAATCMHDDSDALFEKVIATLRIPENMKPLLHSLLKDSDATIEDDAAVIKGTLLQLNELNNNLIAEIKKHTETEEPAKICDEIMEVVGTVQLNQLPVPVSAVIALIGQSLGDPVKWNIKKEGDKVVLNMKGYLYQLTKISNSLSSMIVTQNHAGGAMATITDNETCEFMKDQGLQTNLPLTPMFDVRKGTDADFDPPVVNYQLDLGDSQKLKDVSNNLKGDSAVQNVSKKGDKNTTNNNEVNLEGSLVMKFQQGIKADRESQNKDPDTNSMSKDIDDDMTDTSTEPTAHTISESQRVAKVDHQKMDLVDNHQSDSGSEGLNAINLTGVPKPAGNIEPKDEWEILSETQKDKNSLGPSKASDGKDKSTANASTSGGPTKTSKLSVQLTDKEAKGATGNKFISTEEDPGILQYVFLMCSKEIAGLKEKYKVSIDVKDKSDPKKYHIKPQKGCPSQDLERACEDFRMLLTDVKKRLKCRIVDLRGMAIDPIKLQKAKKIIEDYQREGNLVLVMSTSKVETNVWKLYSEKKKVLDEALVKFTKTVGVNPPIQKGLYEQGVKLERQVDQVTQSKQQSGELRGQSSEKGSGSDKSAGGGSPSPGEKPADKEPKSKESDRVGHDHEEKGQKESKANPQMSVETITRNCYILQYFFIMNKLEIDKLSKQHKVDIKYNPWQDKNNVYIIPKENCLKESLLTAKEYLADLVDIARKLVSYEVIEFGQDMLSQDVDKATKLLEIYKDSVLNFVSIEKQKMLLLSENQIHLDKAKKVVLSVLGLKPQSSKCIDEDKASGQQADKDAKPKTSDKLDELDKMSKQATVGEDMLPFVFNVYRTTLIDMERTNRVKFVWEGGHDIVIKPSKGNTKCTVQDLEEVYDEFATFIQSLHSKMISKDVDLTEKGLFSAQIEKAVKDTQSNHTNIHIIDSGNHQIRILGEADHVKVAMESFCSDLGVTVPPSRHSGKGKRHGGQKGVQERRDYSYPGDKPGSKVMLEFEVGVGRKTKVKILQGDITKENVDVIANAANDMLIHAGGVAKAIAKAGGSSIQKESDRIMQQKGRLQLSEVVYTGAGSLPCQWVLHTVGPDWRKEDMYTTKEALRACCINLLSMTEGLKAKTIAIPAIGTGIYGVPKQLCAEVMCSAVLEYLSRHHGASILEEIHFIDVDKTTTEVFGKVFEKNLEDKAMLYTKPMDVGADTVIVGRESSVDDPLQSWKHSGTSGSVTSQLTGGGVLSKVKQFSTVVVGGFGSGSSNTDSSLSQGAIRKSTTTNSGTSHHGKYDSEEGKCPICLDKMKNPRELPCKHSFCKDCVDKSKKHQGPSCPVCKKPYGLITGNMPHGTINHSIDKYTHLPGYPRCGTIVITYNFPSGKQGPEHPNPGSFYTGTTRIAYLPDNTEGREVLRLLKIAFDRRLTFTIGTSVTTGARDTVTWNDIHHKTSPRGGAHGYGYPDPDYLKRVKEELAAKGVK